VVGDVLSRSSRPWAAFDTITDCGVFHVFSDEDRPRYVARLRSLLVVGGRYLMLVFSDEEPPGWGPRRVSQDEIRAALSDGWRIESIEAAQMEVRLAPHEVRCWLTIAIAA
jgi:cyclopropane fatty-acyl-phospholipid synthase-like methyltransferase